MTWKTIILCNVVKIKPHKCFICCKHSAHMGNTNSHSLKNVLLVQIWSGMVTQQFTNKHYCRQDVLYLLVGICCRWWNVLNTHINKTIKTAKKFLEDQPQQWTDIELQLFLTKMNAYKKCTIVYKYSNRTYNNKINFYVHVQVYTFKIIILKVKGKVFTLLPRT